jgi:Transcriptional regulatory protein, C terminal
LSRGSNPAGYPTKPLASYQINRQFSGWNLPAHVLTYTDGKTALIGFKITLLSLAILELRAPRVDGCEAVYDKTARVNERAIDAPIKNLRKKFQIADGSFDMIETINGTGYRLKGPAQQ